MKSFLLVLVPAKFEISDGYQVYIERLNSTSIKQGYSGWPKVNIKNRNIKAMIMCVRTSSTIIAEMSDIVWTSLSIGCTQVLRDTFNLKTKEYLHWTVEGCSNWEGGRKGWQGYSTVPFQNYPNPLRQPNSMSITLK